MADPLSVLPEEDSGAATQDRFAWQHHCIAVDCVGLIAGDQNRRVICEIQEDYVVEHNSGSLELVSCKHREGSRGPWKLVDLCLEGGVGHLFGRWSKFAETSLRLMTNGSLATGTAEAAAVARACSKAAEGAPIHDGTDIAMCRDALARALLAAGNRKGFTGIPVITSVSTGRATAHLPIPTDFLAQVEMFMRALKICADLPDRRVVESHHTYQLMMPCLEKLGFDPAHAPISYRQLVELVHRKNTASPLRDAYGEYVWSRRTATASGQQAALVTVRTITADDVLRVIGTSLPRFDGSAATAATARALDPSKIRSRAEFAAQLDALRVSRQLTLRDIEDRDKGQQAARHSTATLNRRNLNDVLNHHRLPSAQFVQAYLDCCGVPASDQPVWLAAWRRAGARKHEPTRVGDASPLELGVQGVGSGNAPSRTLPPYVPRDHDASVRAALKTTGCFLVLVGPSSVGKTRTLYEAVRVVAPNWYVVRPSDVDDIFRLAAEQPRQTILWLDELHHYLGGHRDLSPAVISRLVTAGIMVVGTLWTAEYNALLAPRGGADDHQSHAGSVLQRAEIITIEQTLTMPEHQRAVDLAVGDDRLARALRSTDYTFIQILAGGPALVEWWTELSNPYALAMVEAAVDARRVGVQSAVGAALLTEAMHGYLPPIDRMTDPATWPGRALIDATAVLPGAVSPVRTVDGRSAGSSAGFILADFLVQHVSRVRRTVCPPHSLWSALVSHLVEASDIRRVAASARARMRYRYSEPLLRQLVAAGEGSAVTELADILFSHDRVDDAVALLQSHCQKYPHDETVRVHLAHLGVLQRRVTELRHVTNAAGHEALAEILVDRGWTEGLRLRADAGDPAAQDDLAQLLADRGQIDELDARARAGDTFAADRRAALYADQGRLDQLRALASFGDEPGLFQLARLLARQGLVDELAQRSAVGDRFALDRLTTLASPSSPPTPSDDSGAHDLTAVARLRAEIGTGKPLVHDQLTRLLLERRLAPALWEEMDAGTPQAAERLSSLLMAQEATPGHLLARLRAYGLNADGSVAGPEDWA